MQAVFALFPRLFWAALSVQEVKRDPTATLTFTITSLAAVQLNNGVAKSQDADYKVVEVDCMIAFWPLNAF